MFLVQFWLMKQKHYKIQKVNNNSFFSVWCDIFRSNSLIFNNTVMLSLKLFFFFIFNDHAIVSWRKNFFAILRRKSALSSPSGKPSEAVNYFCEKAPWQMVDWVLNTPLLSPLYFYSLFITWYFFWPLQIKIFIEIRQRHSWNI